MPTWLTALLFVLSALVVGALVAAGAWRIFVARLYPWCNCWMCGRSTGRERSQ